MDSALLRALFTTVASTDNVMFIETSFNTYTVHTYYVFKCPENQEPCGLLGGMRVVGRTAVGRCPSLRSMDAKLAHPEAQCVRMKLQELGRSPFTFDAPFCKLQDVKDIFAFDVFETAFIDFLWIHFSIFAGFQPGSQT